MPSLACRRSAIHAPPVWMPIRAVSGVSSGAMAWASLASRSSASGNVSGIKKSLQYQLGGNGVQMLTVLSAVDSGFVQLLFSQLAGVAFVSQKHRKFKAVFEFGGKITCGAGQVVLGAIRMQRQANNQEGGLPLLNQSGDVIETLVRRCGVDDGEGMGPPYTQFPRRNPRSFQAKIKCKDGPAFRHGPPRRTGWKDRCREA